MLGRNILWFLMLIYVMRECSSSKLRRSLIRRQVDSQPCQTIQGFDCKCLYHRTTCTNDRDLPTPIVIVESAKGQYETVEIVLSAQRDIQVNDQTFEPIKDLFKSDANNYEFRIKFEKFTALHLDSPGIFNRVFPSTNSRAQKHISLEIYNPDVPQKDNKRLFENLNVKTLELYALYPFHGTFQELFNGANIKYIRLTGGDIRSDFSQPFTGNIARLELAKQATSLSVENFPVYPAHEMIINAYYISDFTNEHVPNYNNLVELRVHSTETIPANAFRHYPNIQTLSLTSEKDIDSQALNGLNQLEKLIIKDTKPSQELLNNLPSVKEFETNIDKLDERTQCQFLEKLANGQLALRAVPNGQHCTCISAYLDTAAGQHACKPDGCQSSSCSAIRNNYDSNEKTFQSPPKIHRADGSDALGPKPDKVYSSPYQISRQDQEKVNRAIPHQQQQHEDHQHDGQHQQQPDIRPDDRYKTYDDDHRDEYDHRPHHPAEHREDPQPPMRDENDQNDNSNRFETNDYDQGGDHQPSKIEENIDRQNDKIAQGYQNDYDQPVEETKNDKNKPSEHSNVDHQDETKPSSYHSDYDLSPVDLHPKDKEKEKDDDHHDHSHHDGQVGDGQSNTNDDDDQDGTKVDNVDGTNPDDQSNRDSNDGNVNPSNPDDETNRDNGDQDGTTSSSSSSESTGTTKKGMSWLPIIIIVAAIVGLLLLGAIYLFVCRKRSQNGSNAPPNPKGYQPTPTNEAAAAKA